MRCDFFIGAQQINQQINDEKLSRAKHAFAAVFSQQFSRCSDSQRSSPKLKAHIARASL